MSSIVLKVGIACGIAVWLLVCLTLYKRSRRAAWLASSAVASCLFFLGATVAASFLVNGALALTPLWLGIVGLSFVHLKTALDTTTSTKSSFSPQTPLHPPPSFPPNQSNTEYI